MSQLQRPNILLILTDQQRFDTINAGGNPYIRTPHLNWLHDTGVHFRRCYSDAPVCAPARSTMLTGRHYYNLAATGNGHFGQVSAPDVSATLPSILTRAGYQTRAVGKLHYHPPRSNFGFEHTERLEHYYRYMARHPELGVPMDHGLGQNEMEPGISTVHESNSLTRWTAERAADFLELRDPTRPFFLQVGFTKPHPPFDPCETYWNMYANADVPAPVYGEWSEDVDRIPGGFMHTTWLLNGCDQFDDALLRDVRRAYYACITQVDYNLGYLFARMRELDLLRNTLIVFTSDHGEMLGDHHMGAKSMYYEGSAHVPMLVVPPGDGDFDLQRGSDCDSLVCLADLMPTFLKAAGVDAPDGVSMDGIDLIAAAHGDESRERLICYNGDHMAVIDGHWKYMFTSIGAAEMLFDLSMDPYEQVNLAAEPAHQDRRSQMRAALAAEVAHVGSPAVRGCDLVQTAPAPTRREARSKPWPGFHSRIESLTDVLQ